MLKKIAALLGGVISVVSLAGCGVRAEELPPEEQVSYETGWILQVSDTCVYMVPDEGGVPDGIGSITSVGFKDVNWQDAEGQTVSAADLSPGQQIRYNMTMVLETWPAQLYGCDSVTLTGGQADVSELVAKWNEWNEGNGVEDPYGMPKLQVLYSDDKIASCALPLKGTSTWYNDGTGVCQDSDHPLRWKDDHLVSISLQKAAQMQLNFAAIDKAPDKVVLRCWDQSERGQTAIPEGEIVTLDESHTFTAKPDSVYELSATWDDETVGGTLSWGFQTCADGA